MYPELNKSIGWTWFVRATHWIVAICVLVNFFNDTGYWHRTIGYLCLGLVLARIVYGLLISKVSSSQFYLPGFKHLKAHVKELCERHVPTYPGHNPLGQWAVYFMWLLIALLAFTGWLSRTDAYWGEDWPVDFHEILSNILLGFVILHLLAIALMSKLQKHNLVKAMLVSKRAD